MRIWQIMWLKYDLTIASAFYYSQLGNVAYISANSTKKEELQAWFSNPADLLASAVVALALIPEAIASKRLSP